MIHKSRNFLPVLIIFSLIILQDLVASPADADFGIFISEVRIDQTGSDSDEYFELAGTAGTALDDLTYLVLGDSGSTGSGIIEQTVDLSGHSIPAGGYFVAAQSSFSLGTAQLVTSLNFENGDNVTHLLVRGFQGANGNDLDTDNDGVLDETPWLEIVDLVAIIEEENPPGSTEYHYGPPTVGPDDGAVPGLVFRCQGGWEIGSLDVSTGDDTPGAANRCPASIINQVVINEIDYDQFGRDRAEFIEIKNSGTGIINLTGYSIELINGGSAGPYQVIQLPDFDLAAGAYFVICGDSASLAICDLDVSPNQDLIQNGAPDAVALALNGEIVDAVSYEGDIGSPYTEGSGTGLVDNPAEVGLSLARFPDGADTDQNNLDFSPRCATPGASNLALQIGCALEADLQVNLSDDPDPAVAGSIVTYALFVRNNGPGRAEAVTLTDSLPAEFSPLSVSTNEGSCSIAAGLITCELGDLVHEAEVTVTIVATAAGQGVLTNTVIVDSGTPDPEVGNNSVEEQTEVQVRTPELVNSMLLLEHTDIAYVPVPRPGAPAGALSISANFSSLSATTLEEIFFEVVTLTGGNVMLNADGGPSGVGATVSVSDDALGQNAGLDPGETFEITFEVGLAQPQPFTLLVDAYAIPVGSVLRPFLEAGNNQDSFLLEVSQEQIRSSPTLYLPILLK